MNSGDKPDSSDGTGELAEHLAACPECSMNAQELDRMIDSLKDHKLAFCPKPWELHDFTQQGDDPGGRIGRHVELCPACADEVEDFKQWSDKPEPVPQWYSDALAESKQPEPKKRPSIPARIPEFFFSLWNIPVMAVATAAAVMVIMLVYPTGEVKPFLGLSTSRWGRIPGMTLMSPDRPKVAIVVIIQDQRDRWPQDRVDALNQALKPTGDLKSDFEFLTPNEVRECLQGEPPSSKKRILAGKLAKSAGVAKVVFLTVASTGTTHRVQAQAIDAKTGETEGLADQSDVASSDLSEQAGKAALSVLQPAKAGNR